MKGKEKKGRSLDTWKFSLKCESNNHEEKGASLFILSFISALLITAIFITIQQVGDAYIILNFIGRIFFLGLASYTLISLIGLFHKSSKLNLFSALLTVSTMVKVLKFDLWPSLFLVAIQ